jgi:Ring finger domain
MDVNEDGDLCVICMDTSDNKNHEFLTKLPCKHTFHSTCLIEYFHKSSCTRCPICRYQVVHEMRVHEMRVHVTQDPGDQSSLLPDETNINRSGNGWYGRLMSEKTLTTVFAVFFVVFIIVNVTKYVATISSNT